MSLHSWFGRHEADTKTSRWDAGHFVTTCTVCACPMIKLPGMPWKAASRP